MAKKANQATSSTTSSASGKVDTSNKNAEKVFSGVTITDCDSIVSPPSVGSSVNDGKWTCGDKFNIAAARGDMQLNSGNYWATGGTGGVNVHKIGKIGTSSHGKCTPSVAGHVTAGGIPWKDRVGYGFEQGQIITKYGWKKMNVSLDSINNYSKIDAWTKKNAVAGDVCVMTHGPSRWSQGVPGHACMYDGSHWVSDFYQDHALVYQNNGYAGIEIYRFTSCQKSNTEDKAKNARLSAIKGLLLPQTNEDRINLITDGVGIKNNDSKSWTETLITDITCQIHDNNGKKSNITLQVNKYIADNFTKLMNALYKLKVNDEYFRIEDINVYKYGKIYGTDKLSMHSYGVAIDINSKYNPFNKAKRNPNGENTVYAIRKGHPIIELMEKYGFKWGGKYGDTMHFSYIDGE